MIYAMQSMHLEQALQNIISKDPRFSADAYEFLKQALDFTVTEHQKHDPEMTQHVSALELLAGFRDLALKEYGPMASTLLTEWGVESCEHIGDMVFNMIAEGMFGKQDSDKRSDFAAGYSFQEAFVQPFLPKSQQKKARA